MFSVCVDLETTGIKDAEILQCSVVSVYGDVIFNRHFKPERVTSWPDAERINHISPADVKDCPPFSAAVKELSDIFRRCSVIIGYNHSAFDLPLLSSYGVYINPAALQVDLMKIFAPVYGVEREGGGYKWQKLSTMAEYFKCWLSPNSLHDAVADCFASLHCFYSFFGAFGYGFDWSASFTRSFKNTCFPVDDLPMECERAYSISPALRVFLDYPDHGYPAYDPIEDGSTSIVPF